MPSEFWEKLRRVDAVSNEGRLIFLCMIMGGATILAGLEALLLMSWTPVYAAMLGWVFVVVYWMVQGSAVGKGGDIAGQILVPSGSSTPSVNQHSNIEAMEARGKYADAAKAYQDVIAAQPADLVACEKLGQLALRQLRDYPLAIFAYREAEKRSDEPARKLGYAMIVAGIYRDNLKDVGKALVELRRVVSRYPDAPNRARLSAEIDELKAMHFEGQ